ncbi:MAG: hypothetical protein NC133_00520 [Prevotella sp.]|nr:hypothetical protein [Prevotella sp.]
MNKLSKINREQINPSKIKDIFQKGVQIGMLGAALATGVMMTGCAQATDGKEWVDDNEQIDDTKKSQPYDVVIGNGNYTLHNFGGEDTYFLGSDGKVGTPTVVGNVNYYLDKAETYIKGLVDRLEKSLEGRPAAKSYFDEIITTLKANNYYNIWEVDPGGLRFDNALDVNYLSLNKVFTDIIKNLDTPDERGAFYLSYRVLAGESYKEGLGNRRNYNSEQMRDYNAQKEAITTMWYQNSLCSNTNLDKIYKQNDFTIITNNLDGYLNQAVTNMNQKQNLGLQASDLRQCLNIALTCNSLGALHDYTKTILTHTGCLSSNNLNFFVQTMQTAAEEAYQADQQAQTSLSR